MQSFSELGLPAALAAGLDAAGYVRPTPIQAAALPAALDGRDVLGLAQTGTGKTAAFALPVLKQLSAREERARPGLPRALIVLPTRELALQVAEVLGTLGSKLPLTVAVVHGGVSLNPQIRSLKAGVDILVATPGRLLDLMQQKVCSLKAVELFVLDEADRMLDMGFLPDVRKVVAQLPKPRQTLFFSATMPNDVAKLAAGLLHDHVRVEVAAPATTVERIGQSVVLVEPAQKVGTLVGLLSAAEVARAIIFTRTKRGANKLSEQLLACGIEAAPYHANKSQPARERALAGFKSGATRALVATDIAARGIDVDGVTHVFNFDLPEVPEAYVHRIGRTGRAGRDGIAISLCSPADRPLLTAIEKLIRQPVPRASAPVAAVAPVLVRAPAERPAPRPAARPGAARKAAAPRKPAERAGDEQRRDAPGRDSVGREVLGRDGETGERKRRRRRRGGGQEGASVSGGVSKSVSAAPAAARPSGPGTRPAGGKPGAKAALGKTMAGKTMAGQPTAAKTAVAKTAVAKAGGRPARTAESGSGEWLPQFLRRPAGAD
ncbi:DEAD/DEAH box helicase [Oleisolibacter albus]|uniref:DEAD/DEAH box helicase n=1 Tax=Oleisolibacter albus TaxID=2171757 RepID=UPI000DF31BF1|nr:DEAD/DEAH box helicase [Oleisolibacter albus]